VSSNDQDHADENVGCRSTNGEAVGNDSNVICFKGASCASHGHGVAQVTIHSQVASRGIGVIQVHFADMAMY
jgi:hypothetical protein